MRRPPAADLRLGAIVCGIVGLYDVLYVATTLTGTAVLGLPPVGLLPVGLLPVGAAVAAFLVVTAAAAEYALRSAGLRLEAVLAILVSPAAVWVVIAGHNTYLSLALLYGGFALLERRPVLVPLALLCAREWRASGAAAAEMFERVHAHMTTLLAAAKILGAGDGTAMALQVAGSLLAVGAAIWAFARHGPSHARTAVLVTATFLVSPYTLNYDLLPMMPAVALLFLQPPAGGYLPGERIACLAVWLIPHFCLELNAAGLPGTPLVVIGFGAVALMRLGTAR